MELKQKNMVSISIIMPLYNAEKYLKQSIDSILKQTFTEYELICINDASTDSTLNIIKEYQKKDYRIKLFENDSRQGAAFSRNKGIEESKGKYIIFLDGDDIFDEEMLSLTYKTAEIKKTDIVVFDYIHASSEKIYEKKEILQSKSYKEKFCTDTFSITDHAQYVWVRWSTGPCNKLYNTNFIKENCIRFQTLSSANDVYFVCMTYLLSKRIIFLEHERILLYARDHSTHSRISSRRDPMCVFKALHHLKENLIKRNIFEQYSGNYYYMVFFMIKYTLSTLTYSDKKEFYSFLKKEGIDYLIGSKREFNTLHNKELKSYFQWFKEKDIESGWYTDIGLLYFYLQDKGEILKNVLSCWANKNVSIWGAGINGKILVEFCKENNIDIYSIIDSDESKRNSYILDKKITLFQDICNEIDLILFSASNIYQQVKKMVDDKGMAVIDINEVMNL